MCTVEMDRVFSPSSESGTQVIDPVFVLGSSLTQCLVFLSQVVVDGTESSVVLQHLNSQTEYQVAVFAVYTSSASEGLRGSETTREFPLS